MLASCKNCCQGSNGKCELGLRPPEGELLCGKYAMTVGFREELLALMRKEIQNEINQATLHVHLREAEKAQAFAG